jgi:hypothetical protein
VDLFFPANLDQERMSGARVAGRRDRHQRKSRRW